MRLDGLQVAVDVQHLHRTSKPRDRGAVFRRPDGLVVTETDLSQRYAALLVSALRRRGAQVLTNDSRGGVLVGFYSERARQAAAWGAHLFLACHVNAGAGRYGMTMHLDRQPAAQLPCQLILEGLLSSTAFPIFAPPLVGSRVRELGAVDRGRACLSGLPEHTRTLGVLLEPFFIDAPTHEHLQGEEGLARVADGIGRGVSEWWSLTRPLPLG